MTNLMLTGRCNLTCDFCFAVDLMDETSKIGMDVSFKLFRAYIDFLDRSGLEQARLIGGEPTLHPEFSRFVKYAYSHKKKILIFSNGLIPTTVLDTLVAIPPAWCKVLINLTSGDGLAPVRRRQEYVLNFLGKRACPGYTISRLEHPPLSQLLDLIDLTGCQRCLRMAMAQPSESSNKFIHPKQYRQVAQQIIALVIEAHKRKVRVEFDCGFVRCMFSNDEMLLLQNCDVAVAWYCGPVWDITPDASAFPCFALSEQLVIQDGLEQGLDELKRKYDSDLSLFRVAGVFPECSSCKLRVTERCSGGCLAVTIKRLRHTPITRVFSSKEASVFIKSKS